MRGASCMRRRAASNKIKYSLYRRAGPPAGPLLHDPFVPHFLSNPALGSRPTASRILADARSGYTSGRSHPQEQ